ncbi:LemA family protein [Bradymonadaceae bacterium TMQ3]|uniref:LemA family protein n=1 Tax=Lujinxingia sediminis TaxID=2480984 RepID=A0ABY0CVS0_9DELT|nr:LemA family protein [Lujinxingia sediminis]RDV39986.1 LemA family protein [Bradymonadaceae bacterium TMQ3]RVU47967.1 LemA family protein [Lujinxingia sediminis]TXC77268.1 LemA family protein [Bradymonadales bacterium TMQ1]
MGAVLVVLGVMFLGVVVLVVFGVGIYNKLVTLRNRFRNAFSQIDVQLKRRYDLIPNLVETAKSFMAHERETLEAVIQARNAAQSANQRAAQNPGDAQAIQGLMGAEAALTGSLGKLFALSEAYPELKSDKTMSGLMEELTSTENRIAFARQAFNDAVTTYNTARESFPAVLFAPTLGFQPAMLFEIQNPTEREAVRVSFG